MTNYRAAWLAPALLAFASLAAAGVNEFTAHGPDGGAIYAVAAQPGHPDVLLAASLIGIHRSDDGGLTWTRSQSGGQTAARIEFDPVTPDTVYAVNGRVLRSTDAGRTFSVVATLPQSADSLAVSGNRIYVGSLYGNVYRSDDDAQTWTPVTVPWTTGTPSLYTLAVAPTNDDVVYACVWQQGTFKSTDHGGTWSAPPAAPSPCYGGSAFTYDMHVSPADPQRVVAATAAGILITTNGGTSWTFATNSPSTQWVAFDPAVPANLFGADYGGRILRSFDGGLTWPFVSAGANARVYENEAGVYTGAAGHLVMATSKGPMVSTDNGATLALRTAGIRTGDVRQMVAADDGTVYAMFFYGQTGIWRRALDGSWTALDNAELETHVAGGLDLMDLAVSPTNPARLYVADQGLGLLRSDDGGTSWHDPPASLNMQVFGVAIDPTNADIAYAARAQGGMRRTVDGGQTWTSCGLANNIPVDVIRVDRSDPHILYATGSYPPYNVVHKSIDSCASFAPSNAPSNAPFADGLTDVVIDPTNHDHLFVTRYFGAERSVNAGASWQTMTWTGLASAPVLGYRLLVDPQIQTTLWMINADLPGIARSVDDGATWQRIDTPTFGAQRGSFLRSGVLHPLHPDTLIAGAENAGILELQVAPDLSVTLPFPAYPQSATGTEAITLRVRNHGPYESSASEVTLTLPAFVDVPTPGNCTLTGVTLRCPVGALRVDQVVDIPVTLHFTQPPGNATMTLTVTGHEADCDTSNNSETWALSHTAQVQLDVTLAAAATALDRGASTRVTAIAHNGGVDAAQGARVVFELGAFTAAGFTNPRGACAVSGTSATCELGALAANESVTVSFDATATEPGDRGIYAVLRDTSGIFQALKSVVLAVRPVADLGVTLTDSADPVNAGAAYQYTATARNVAGDASTATLELTLAGATVTGATSARGTCTNTATTVSCALQALVAGGDTATVTVNATAGVAGTATASATLAYAGTDNVTPNNATSAITTIASPPPVTPPVVTPPAAKKGGGRFEWLTLLMLAGALAARGRGHQVRRSARGSVRR